MKFRHFQVNGAKVDVLRVDGRADGVAQYEDVLGGGAFDFCGEDAVFASGARLDCD